MSNLKAVKYWWLFLVAGILFVGLGIYFLCNYDKAFSFVAIFTVIYFLVSGIGGVIAAIADREIKPYWGVNLTAHILETIVGFILLFNPGTTVIFLLVMCGLGFLFQGISLITTSVALNNLGVSNWWLMLVFGILILLFSFTVMASPALSFILICVLLGISTIFFGAAVIALGCKMKKLKDLA